MIYGCREQIEGRSRPLRKTSRLYQGFFFRGRLCTSETLTATISCTFFEAAVQDDGGAAPRQESSCERSSNTRRNSSVCCTQPMRMSQISGPHSPEPWQPTTSG